MTFELAVVLISALEFVSLPSSDEEKLMLTENGSSLSLKESDLEFLEFDWVFFCFDSFLTEKIFLLWKPFSLLVERLILILLALSSI